MRYFGLGKDRNVTKFSNAMDKVIQNEPQLYPAVSFIKHLLITYESFSFYDISNSAYERSLSFVMENKIFITATVFYFVFYSYFYISLKRQDNE